MTCMSLWHEKQVLDKLCCGEAAKSEIFKCISRHLVNDSFLAGCKMEVSLVCESTLYSMVRGLILVLKTQMSRGPTDDQDGSIVKECCIRSLPTARNDKEALNLLPLSIMKSLSKGCGIPCLKLKGQT